MEELFVYNDVKKSKFEPMIDKKWFMLSPRQTLQVKTKEELEAEFGVLENMPGYSEILGIEKSFGRKFQNSPGFMFSISQFGFRNTSIAKKFKTENGMYSMIPLNAIKICNTKKIDSELERIEQEKKTKVEIEKKEYSIHKKASEKEVTIMDEMIAKANKKWDILKNIFNIANRGDEVNDDIISDYLRDWAYNKYEFYLLFGKNLSVEKEIDISINDYEFQSLVRELSNKCTVVQNTILNIIPNDTLENNFINNVESTYTGIIGAFDNFIQNNYSVFSPIVDTFSVGDFLDDKLPHNENHEKYFEDKYVVGSSLIDFLEKNFDFITDDDNLKEWFSILRNMTKIKTRKGAVKLSKFLSKLFNDTQFDIELSKLFQHKNEKGTLVISIDPVDYLMMSMNKHGWSSCQRVINGCYSSAPFAYMLDNTTLISYIHNKNTYHYDGIRFSTATVGSVNYGDREFVDFGNNQFDYYSFRSRELIYMDKKTCGLAFALGYCNMTEETYKQFRLFMEHIVSDYLGLDEKWMIARPSNGKNTSRDKNNKYKISAIGTQVYLDPVQAFAYIKGATNIYDTVFKVGVKSTYCLNCGGECTYTDNICGNCK